VATSALFHTLGGLRPMRLPDDVRQAVVYVGRRAASQFDAVEERDERPRALHSYIGKLLN
jgi:hypothetical protein